MPPIEVVIDGTNFGGKTPLVARLLERMRERGWRVESASPYREVEVYSLWDSAPLRAATTIVDRMTVHRERAAEADVLLWDRGWPTCYIATKDASSRALFQPLPRLTFILLNTAETTEKKVQKYQIKEESYPWMHRHRLKDEISYRELAARFADGVTTFEPTLEESRFDLELISSAILAELEAERSR